MVQPVGKRIFRVWTRLDRKPENFQVWSRPICAYLMITIFSILMTVESLMMSMVIKQCENSIVVINKESRKQQETKKTSNMLKSPLFLKTYRLYSHHNRSLFLFEGNTTKFQLCEPVKTVNYPKILISVVIHDSVLLFCKITVLYHCCTYTFDSKIDFICHSSNNALQIEKID